jgi:hypothetical protein
MNTIKLTGNDTGQPVVEVATPDDFYGHFVYIDGCDVTDYVEDLTINKSINGPFVLSLSMRVKVKEV